MSCRRRSDEYNQCDQLLLCNVKTDLYEDIPQCSLVKLFKL